MTRIPPNTGDAIHEPARREINATPATLIRVE